MLIGKIAKDVRKSLGIKQEEFAYRLGISREYYSRIENQKIEPGADLTISIIEAIKYFLVTNTQKETDDTTYKAAVEICLLLPQEHRSHLAQILRSNEGE